MPYIEVITWVARAYGFYSRVWTFHERASEASEWVKCSNERIKTVFTSNPCNNLFIIYTKSKITNQCFIIWYIVIQIRLFKFIITNYFSQTNKQQIRILVSTHVVNVLLHNNQFHILEFTISIKKEIYRVSKRYMLFYYINYDDTISHIVFSHRWRKRYNQSNFAYRFFHTSEENDITNQISHIVFFTAYRFYSLLPERIKLYTYIINIYY